MTAGTLSLVRLTRRFGAYAAVDGLSLEIGRGELLALIGASGSGKTTTLRMVAGYEVPDAGQVRLDGRDITHLPPQRRNFGMVFQHYALFPHLPVGENVAFGLEARGVAKREQRVALARALVIEPQVLLLDEPLSNLDPTLRSGMRQELRATLTRLGVTALFVTHDQEDAFAVADRVALIRAGRLLQVGTPEDLYDRPASRAVAEFIGRSTLVPAVRDGAGAGGTGGGAAAAVQLPIGGRAPRVAAEIAAGTPPDAELLAVLRPDALEFAPPDALDAWPGVVTTRRFAGALLAYHVRVGDEVELELFSTDRAVRPGDRVGVRVAREPVAVVAV